MSEEDFLEHMERVCLLSAEIGTNIPKGEAVSIGAKRKTKGNELLSSVRRPTYDVDEAKNNSSDEESASCSAEPLNLVASDSDDDNGSPSAGRKTKSRLPIKGMDETITPQKALGPASIKNRGVASGRGKRSIDPVEEMNDFGKFIQVIGDTARSQAEREKVRIEIEMEKAKKEERFEWLRIVQQLVKDNPESTKFKSMLEALADEIFLCGRHIG